MKILIVDDDRTILGVLGQMLAELGHVATSARDGTEALSALERDRPDLVFLDYLMPRVSGLEVLRTLKQRMPRTYVALLTGMSAVTISRMTGVHRADAVLEKPVRKAAVERILARAAAKQRGGSRRS